MPKCNYDYERPMVDDNDDTPDHGPAADHVCACPINHDGVCEWYAVHTH